VSSLYPAVDPNGLLEYSVVYTDRSLNHMSQAFQGVMRDIAAILKRAYAAIYNLFTKEVIQGMLFFLYFFTQFSFLITALIKATWHLQHVTFATGPILRAEDIKAQQTDLGCVTLRKGLLRWIFFI